MNKELIINEIRDLEDQINTKTEKIVSALIQNNDTFADAWDSVKHHYIQTEDDPWEIKLSIYEILTAKIIDVAAKQATHKE